jgi:hypothetical protein
MYFPDIDEIPAYAATTREHHLNTGDNPESRYLPVSL